MKSKRKLVVVYATVMVCFAVALGYGFYISKQRQKNAADVIKANDVTHTLESDIVLVNQEGEEIRLSDLKGKVWAFSQFYAACPMCADRNGKGLRQIYDAFKANPDFHMVCVTVNPKKDGVETLKSYANSLGADSKNWWFLTGDPEQMKEFMITKMKYQPTVERENATDAATKGIISHDMAISVYNREMSMVSRFDPYAASQKSDAQYAEVEKQILEAIGSELKK